jgi:acetolactate synthase-1/2/3 large subunit
VKATGAQLLARTLAACGVEYVSGIPGHTIFPFANIVKQEGLTPFLVRSEAISPFAADVYYRLSGKLMAVFAHSVPGTTNLAAGLANAYADSSALILISGETARDSLGRGAYQELSRQFDGDVAGFTRHLTKRSWLTHTPWQLVEHTLRAAKVATLGRPGPVSLHVFQDVWDQEIEVPAWPDSTGYLITNDFRPSDAAIERAASLIGRAKRPVIVAGNGVNLGRAQARLVELAERLNAYVVTTVTGKGAFPENHPLSLGVVGWVGTEAANSAALGADLVLAIGARLSETATSSWQEGGSFRLSETKLIQCDVDPAEIATVFPVDVALVGDAGLTLDALAESCEGVERRAWQDTMDRKMADWRTRVAALPDSREGLMQVAPVVRELRASTLGRPVTIVGDIGKNHKWPVQQFEAHAGDAVVSSMGAGTMGFGTCGAVGAALARPESRVISWCGDGGLSMTSYVLPTVAEHQLPITFVVIDDGAFGEVANIQEERYGRTIFSEFNGSGRNSGYHLRIDALSEASGIPARRVESPADLKSAFQWAAEVDGPALVDVIVDRRSRVPSGGGSKLSEIWKHPIHPWSRPALSHPDLI